MSLSLFLIACINAKQVYIIQKRLYTCIYYCLVYSKGSLAWVDHYHKCSLIYQPYAFRSPSLIKSLCDEKKKCNFKKLGLKQKTKKSISRF